MPSILFNLLDAELGGGQRVSVQIARELRSQGWRIGVVVPEEGPILDDFAGVESIVHRKDVRTLRRPLSMIPLSRILVDYDLLYSHTSIPGAIIGSGAAVLARKPHLTHQHSPPTFSNRPLVRAVQRFLSRRLLSRAFVIAVSEHVKDLMLESGIPTERMRVIHNGVRRFATQERDRQGDRCVVGALGRLDPAKGFETFLSALTMLPNSSPVDARLGIRPGAFPEYERRIRQRAAEVHVEVLEGISDGSGFLRELDVVVVPSRREGLPLVLLEAMALGKPVVASAIPGIAEVMSTGDCGWLVPPDDPLALARAITRVCEDPAAAEAVGMQARRVVEAKYSLSKSVASTVAIIEEVVRGG